MSYYYCLYPSYIIIRDRSSFTPTDKHQHSALITSTVLIHQITDVIVATVKQWSPSDDHPQIRGKVMWLGHSLNEARCYLQVENWLKLERFQSEGLESDTQLRDVGDTSDPVLVLENFDSKWGSLKTGTYIYTHTRAHKRTHPRKDGDEVCATRLWESGSICACISCHNRKKGTAPPDKSVCVCSCVCVL